MQSNLEGQRKIPNNSILTAKKAIVLDVVAFLAFSFLGKVIIGFQRGTAACLHNYCGTRQLDLLIQVIQIYGELIICLLSLVI